MICNRCNSNEAKITLTLEHESERLCWDCYNEMMSSELGVTLEEQPGSIGVKDVQGILRFFTIEKYLSPVGISLEAIETIEFGYKFAVLGELDCDQTGLFEELLSKVETGLSRQYIKKGKFPNGQEYNSMVSDEIAGRIEYDESREGVPLINIDGKPYTWEEIGKMLMTNEGFQFKLKVFDITDDVD